MNILYLSAHATMEFNEVKLLKDLGFNVQSIGFYTDPANPVDSTRGNLSDKSSLEFIEKFKHECPDYKLNGPVRLTKDLVKDFDIIINMQLIENITWNWDLIKDKLVIRRSVGLSNSSVESTFKPYYLQGMKTIRVSPKEELVPGYYGADSIIRASVDPDEFKGWTGENSQVLTIQKRMKKAAHYTRYDIYEAVTNKFNRVLCGKENEDLHYSKNDISYDEIQNYLKTSRVYFSGCSRPAPITYTFVEAMLTGCPVVSVGPNIANFTDSNFGKVFEHHEFIENGINGFWSDDVEELKMYIQILLDDRKLCETLSSNARRSIINTFHPNRIRQDWKDFFNTLKITTK